jgi:hypothetical protein
MSFGSTDNGGSRSFGLRKGFKAEILEENQNFGKEAREIRNSYAIADGNPRGLDGRPDATKNVELRIEKGCDCRSLARQLHITNDFTFSSN